MSRGGKKAVEVLFLDGVILTIEFALNGVDIVGGAGFRDEIDAGVFAIKAVFLCPIGVGPDGFEEIRIEGFIAEISAAEFFEVGAFLALGDGGVAIRGEDGFEWAGHAWFRRCCVFERMGGSRQDMLGNGIAEC